MDALTRSQGHITPESKKDVLKHMSKLGENKDTRYVYETWDMVRESTDDEKRKDFAHILGKPKTKYKPKEDDKADADATKTKAVQKTWGNLIKRGNKTVVHEGIRLIKTHTKDGRTAKVYKDSDAQEHRVKFFVDGKHKKTADYHTDDAHDAHDTAKHWLQENEMNEDVARLINRAKRFLDMKDRKKKAYDYTNTRASNSLSKAKKYTQDLYTKWAGEEDESDDPTGHKRYITTTKTSMSGKDRSVRSDKNTAKRMEYVNKNHNKYIQNFKHYRNWIDKSNKFR